jgi:hypothetical protein
MEHAQQSGRFPFGEPIAHAMFEHQQVLPQRPQRAQSV